jgi:hypothetical protein
MELLAQEFSGTWLERLMHPSIVICFFIFGMPVLIWGIKSVLTSSARARVIEAELQLKRELVAQGRSAEEIDRIVGKSACGKIDG